MQRVIIILLYEINIDISENLKSNQLTEPAAVSGSGTYVFAINRRSV